MNATKTVNGFVDISFFNYSCYPYKDIAADIIITISTWTDNIYRNEIDILNTI